MRNSLCEKLIWIVLSPTIFKHMGKSWKNLDLKYLKKLSKNNYKAMIRRTPDIGNVTKNSLRMVLACGMLWFSIYDAMEGKMSHDEFGDMVIATTESKLLQKNFKDKKPFTLKAQKKEIEKHKIANAVSNSEFNWNTEFVLGRDENEYTAIYHQCGLCALGRQEHHEDLIPYFCKLDYKFIEFMGGVLKRSGTIATGANYCDFYICKKGSKWDK